MSITVTGAIIGIMAIGVIGITATSTIIRATDIMALTPWERWLAPL
ncbi:hypothetical protein WOC76_22750 [Methylocystis sp. IM3]|jgi:hypothetical protein